MKFCNLLGFTVATVAQVYALALDGRECSAQNVHGTHSVGERIVASLFCVFSDRIQPAFATYAGSQVLESRTEIRAQLKNGLPILVTDISALKKKWLMSQLPISHDSQDDSALLFIDTFHDINGGSHYRLFHLPAGQDPLKVTDSHPQNVTFTYSRHVSAISEETLKTPAVTDAAALESSEKYAKFVDEITRDIQDYLAHCGGEAVDIVQCHNFMLDNTKFGHAETRAKLSLQLSGDGKDGTVGMVPESGAVWREFIETTFRYWKVQWGHPFPFKQEQLVSHRLNSYWYVYVQAPPYQAMYYVFLLVDGLHNPNTQLSDSRAVGFYLSNLEIDLHSMKADGNSDSENLYWMKSSPGTQNTQHTIGRSWSSTDSYSLNMNLGFKGKEVHGDLNFNYTKSFTASYSETRDITDWSVVENTDPVHGQGKWRYFQQWPVDMLLNSVYNFPQNWPFYYDQEWNPCKVKDVPNLSKYALATHNTMGKNTQDKWLKFFYLTEVWAVNPKLKGPNGCPVRFEVEFHPRVTAHACEVFDGHHKIGQNWIDYTDMKWIINVADLNNILRE